MSQYGVKFTASAHALISALSLDLDETEVLVRREINELGTDPLEIFFHTIPVTDGGYDGPCLICSPRDDVMIVSASETVVLRTQIEVPGVGGVKEIHYPQPVDEE